MESTYLRDVRSSPDEAAVSRLFEAAVRRGRAPHQSGSILSEGDARLLPLYRAVPWCSRGPVFCAASSAAVVAACVAMVWLAVFEYENRGA